MVITKQLDTENSQKDYAKYLSDKATFETPDFKSYLNKNSEIYPTKDGLYPERITKSGSVVYNVLPENYERWAAEENKKIVSDNSIREIKDKISSWAYNWDKDKITVIAEIKLFLEENECDYSLSDLKASVIQEAKKRKDKIKKQKIGDIEKKKEEQKENFQKSNFEFSAFGNFTDFLEMARKFHKIQPFYFDQYRIWWLWNNNEKKWERVDDIDLMNAIDEHTQNPTTNKQVKAEILEAMQRIGRKNRPKDAKRTWIQFKNLIYDLETQESFPATSEYFITNPIPWDMGTSDETPIMDKILKQWVYKQGIQDESYVQTLKEIMAYSLLSYMPIHRIFCFIGAGLNGKGSFLRVIERLVGKENKCATEIELISSNRFESSKLHKKLVCFIGEVDKGIFKKTKTIKSLTGEDNIRIEFKGKDGFDGKNYANPLIATNHLPETSDKTKGFYRRWTIVDFPNQFNEKQDVVTEIPEHEFQNFCNQCKKILKNLITNGEFKNDGTIQEREDKYERHSNNINEFTALYCEENEDSHIEFSDFCEKYNEYLSNTGSPKKSKIEIGRSIVLKGYTKKVKKVAVNFQDTTKMCIEKIKWKAEVEELW